MLFKGLHSYSPKLFNLLSTLGIFALAFLHQKAYPLIKPLNHVYLPGFYITSDAPGSTRLYIAIKNRSQHISWDDLLRLITPEDFLQYQRCFSYTKLSIYRNPICKLRSLHFLYSQKRTPLIYKELTSALFSIPFSHYSRLPIRDQVYLHRITAFLRPTDANLRLLLSTLSNSHRIESYSLLYTLINDPASPLPHSYKDIKYLVAHKTLLPTLLKSSTPYSPILCSIVTNRPYLLPTASLLFGRTTHELSIVFDRIAKAQC